MFKCRKFCQLNFLLLLSIDVYALKEATVETLKIEDLDSEDAPKILTAKDIEDLGLTVGLKWLLAAAQTTLQAPTVKLDVAEPVTTKSLAKNGGLDEILKQIEGYGSLEDLLLALESTEPFINPLASKPSTITRLDNYLHVFLGPTNKATIKEGEKPLLIPDFVSLRIHKTNEDEQEIETRAGQSKENQSWRILLFPCGLLQIPKLCTGCYIFNIPRNTDRHSAKAVFFAQEQNNCFNCERY